ncbi:MAG: ComEC/Rec2 family competence protein [Desulfovibrionaceae bacterium]|nr:ComEC/Rec2 family competence protein [Desulfovibrionaceae bacterium]
MKRSSGDGFVRPLSAFPALLPYQIYLCAFITGNFSSVSPVPTLCVLSLFLFLDLRLHTLPRALFFLFCSALGVLNGLLPSVPSPNPADIALGKPAIISTDKQTLPQWYLNAPNEKRRVCGEIIEVQYLPDNRLRILLRNPAPEKAPQDSLPGLLSWTWANPETEPLPGQQAAVTGIIRPVFGFRNTGMPNYAETQQRKGVFFSIFSQKNIGSPCFSGSPNTEALRLHQLKKLAEGNLPSNRGGAIIAALLFGNRSLLSQKDLDLFRDAGLAHSLALSGQHLSIAGLAAWLILFVVTLVLPRLFLFCDKKTLLLCLSIPPAFCYWQLGGHPPSLTRAFFMLVLWSLWTVAAKRHCLRMTGSDILLTALFFMVLFDASCLFQPGLQLSFTAVTGMLGFHPFIQRILASLSYETKMRYAQKILLIVISLACYSASAQLATLPLVLLHFGCFTPWGWLNLIWLPILALFVLPLSFFGLLCLVPIWGEWTLTPVLKTIAALSFAAAATPAEWLCNMLQFLQAQGMASIWGIRPHWTSICGFYAVLLYLLAPAKHAFPSYQRLLSVGLALLLSGSALRLMHTCDERTLLRILDVGQGQSVLLEYPRHDLQDSTPLTGSEAAYKHIGKNRGRILIDGGGLHSIHTDIGRDVLRPILTHHGRLDLEGLILSHPDMDHLGGFLFLAQFADIRHVFLPPIYPDDETPLYRQWQHILKERHIPQTVLYWPNTIRLNDDIFLETLAPDDFIEGNNGLILRLVRSDGHGLVLFPGDADSGFLRHLVRSGLDLEADILILPHHGSRGSLLGILYELTNPNLAIASAGPLNRYRFPSEQVRRELEKQGIPLRITGYEGEICIPLAVKRIEQ